MGPLRSIELGFVPLAAGSIASATGLTLPVGAQQASGTSCNLSGRILTVGGTVTGAFAPFQVVQGTGIPANTYIVSAGILVGTWNLSNLCTTQTGITVTAFAPTYPDMVILKAVTGNVTWRADGVAPTNAAAGGMLLQTTDPLFEYFGNLAAIQFISATGGINASFYKLAG
jgi:hypothetical protein